MKSFILIFTIFGLLACSSDPVHENMAGTLWMQTSVEYEVLAVQAFQLARLNLQEALKDVNWTAALEQQGDYSALPAAVIVDVDETVLDNSAFEARLVKNGQGYTSDLWAEWVHEGNARAIPGAREFIDFVKKSGAKMFYVTNREQEAPTIKNIQKELDIDASAENVFCKMEKPEWTSDKSSRRAEIAKTHRIVLLIGDDYNDFAFLDKVSPAERKAKAAEQQQYWGKKWIMMPNPLYGNWERALFDYDYSLSDQVKNRKKTENLRLN